MQLILGRVYGEAFARAAVAQGGRLIIVHPELVALRPVAGIQDDVAAGKV